MLSTLVLSLSLAVASPVAGVHGVDEFVVPADEWARPRSGARVSALPALRAAVGAWLELPGTRLAIVHPGGESGALWGTEVRDWLIALGVAPSDVALRPGSPRDDAIMVRLERRR